MGNSHMDIDRNLRSIGKQCYRNCYETAIRLGESFGVSDMLACDPELVGTSEKAQATRASCIRRLVREGLAEKALALARRARRGRRRKD